MLTTGLVTKNSSATEQEVTDLRPLPVTSGSYEPSASFTRPADTNAYSAGDALSNSTSAPVVLTFSNAAPSAGGKMVVINATLEIDANAVPSGMGAFRLHLYGTSPTAINDSAAYDLPSGDRAKYLGWVDLPLPTLLGSTMFSQNVSDRTQFTAASGTIYGILQTVAGYTPTSAVVKTLKLKLVQVGA